MSILQSLLATKRRRVAVAVLVVLAIPALALAWWLGSPLFISKTVDEQFPLTVSAEVPPSMQRADVEAVMEGMAKLDSPMTEPMPPAMQSARKLSAGAFRDADRFHKGSGRATVYLLPDDTHVLRLEEFNVTNGPELHVLLSAHPDPTSRSELMGGDYLDLGKLKGNMGNQNYEVPAGTDVTAHRSVIIYCAPFHVIFSVAPLTSEAA